MTVPGYSQYNPAFVFQPKAGEVASSCTSLFITVEQPHSSDTDASVLCPPAIVSGQSDLDGDSLHYVVHTSQYL